MTLRILAALAVLASPVLARPGNQGQSPSIVPIDSTGFRNILADASGGPVLVNFWATWCVPCVQDFPDLLRVRETYGPRGLKVVFVSIDRESDAGTTVSRFLNSRHVGFTTYIKKKGNDEGFINAVDTAWSGALPATLIYDQHGSLKQLLVDRQSFESLSKIIQPLLKQ